MYMCIFVYVYMCICICISVYPEEGTNGKRQLSFVCWKREKETANFRLFVANGNGQRKLVFLCGEP
jgi:hypothetical protein